MSEPFTVHQAIDEDDFRRLGERVAALTNTHLRDVVKDPIQPDPSPEAIEILLDQPLPETGTEPDAILDFAAEHILSQPRGNGNPGFYGWVISPPAHMPVLTEMLSAAANIACGGGFHGAVVLERCVIGWLKALMGFTNPEAHGVLTSGGSMANLTALAAARHRAAERLGWDIRKQGLQGGPRLVLYASGEVHACVRKSVELMGLGGDAVRQVATDGNLSYGHQKAIGTH